MKMKQKTMRFLSVILMIAMAAAILGGCAQSGTQTDDGGKNQEQNQGQGQGQENPSAPGTHDGVIEGQPATEMVDKVVVQSMASNENPSPFAQSAGGFARNLLYGRLISRNKYGALLEDCTMWLAKSVTKVDDYTYDIELYDYITDNKGNNIDADDVIFSYQMSYELGKFQRIGTSMESLDKTGDYSLRMKLNTKAPGVAEDLMSNSQLDIVDKEWFESTSEEEHRRDPAVTGAYRLVSEVPGSSLVLEAVEDYWQKDPSLNPPEAYQNVKTIEFKVMTEAFMATTALQNHDVDIIRFGNTKNLSTFVENGKVKDGFNMGQCEGTAVFGVFLNMSENSIFANNINLRKAVLYALNAEDIMLAAGFDENIAYTPKTLGAQAMYGAQDKWMDEDYYDYDPEAAADYLEAAGYKPGEVTLTFMASSAADSTCAVIISNLEEAGFKVELLNVDVALFNNYRSDPTQWDLLMDFKGASTGHIAGCWDVSFNPNGFVDGTSICLNKDEELVRLLTAVNDDPTDENINAFHYYLKDQAYCKMLYCIGSIFFTTDKILEIRTNSSSNILPNALVYASDYESGK